MFFASIYVGNICNAVMLHLSEGYMFKIIMAYDITEFMVCFNLVLRSTLKIKVLKFG